VGKVFMKVHSFHEVIQRTRNIIRTSEREFVHVDHIDNVELD
jgi:hypothetical protein